MRFGVACGFAAIVLLPLLSLADSGPEVVASSEPERWGPNILANKQINSIDPLVHTSTISGGGYINRAQRIGSFNDDASYIPGSARIATIGGGYDNLNNQLAGTIAGGAHHSLLGAGDHGTIGGGSWNSILSGSYSVIAGGGGNHIDGDFSVVSGGYRNVVAGTASGIGAGRNNFVDASFSYAVGENNHIEPQAVGSFTFGRDVRTGVPGSFTFSARGSAGQTVIMNLNNFTQGSSPSILLAQGNWTTPMVPENGLWSGEAQVIGVDTVSNQVSSYKLVFVASRQAVLHAEFTPQFDQLGLSAVPAELRIGSNGRLEFVAAGIGGRTIKWNAAVLVSQVNL
jgi:hypothetical protein